MLRKLCMATLIFSTLCLPQMASAATPIKFTKGSYCGSWSGGFKGSSKTFSLGLGGNQEVSIEIADGAHLESFKGPSGELHGSSSNYVYHFRTKKAGQHFITVGYVPPRYADNPYASSYATIQVCAY